MPPWLLIQLPCVHVALCQMLRDFSDSWITPSTLATQPDAQTAAPAKDQESDLVGDKGILHDSFPPGLSTGCRELSRHRVHTQTLPERGTLHKTPSSSFDYGIKYNIISWPLAPGCDLPSSELSLAYQSFGFVARAGQDLTFLQ